MKWYAAVVVLVGCGSPVETKPDAARVDRVIDADVVIDADAETLDFADLTITASAHVRIVGTHAVVIRAANVVIDGRLDVSGGCDDDTPTCAGPGGGRGAAAMEGALAEGCAAGLYEQCTYLNHSCIYGGGGGGGGTSGAMGGGQHVPVSPPCASFDPLVGGSGGARGASPLNVPNGKVNAGGGGGGALQITATSIVIRGQIDAGGAGGASGAYAAKGAGGGGGGTILLDAPTIHVAQEAVIAANGGGGGAVDGTSGAAGLLSTTPAPGGTGRVGGGAGGAGATAATGGAFAGDEGGGGGGGAGLIGIRGGSVNLDGVISPAPMMLQ